MKPKKSIGGKKSAAVVKAEQISIDSKSVNPRRRVLFISLFFI